MAEESSSCFHCGERLNRHHEIVARIGSAAQKFCCNGCMAAAEWLESGGLGDFYSLRERRSMRSEQNADYLAWDSEAFHRTYVRKSGTDQSTDLLEIDITLDGLRCAACAWLIPKIAANLPGIERIDLNAATGRARVIWKDQQIKLSAIAGKLALLGYRARVTQQGVDLERAHRRASLKRLAVAGIAAMQTMMMSEALYFGGDEMAIATRDFFRWFALMLATPVALWAGAPFFRGAWIELRYRRFGMDTLVALSVGIAFVASIIETLRGGPVVYFDTVVMFVFLLLVARHIETMARNHARAAIAHAQMLPATVSRVEENALVEASLHEINVGDLLQVDAGHNIPVDGVLESAQAEVDESLLNGEPQAQRRRRGQPLLAGSVAIGSPLRMRVSAIGAATWLAQLGRLVDRAHDSRPVLAKNAETWAGIFVLMMIAVTAIAGSIWIFIEPARVLPVVLATLAAACPCAFALAVPATLAAAQAQLARRGVLILRSDALERASKCNQIIFDKTGTLTTGYPVIEAVEMFDRRYTEDSALALAAALERGHRHPLARAFMPHKRGKVMPSATAVAGGGVFVAHGKQEFRLGRRQFSCGDKLEDDGRVWLSENGQALAAFSLRDTVRDEAATAVSALHAAGFSTAIFSGDVSISARMLGEQLQILYAQGDLRPDQKLALLKAEQKKGYQVAMVGDGINDAPVLAGADLSIAMGEASPMAQKCADIVLLRPSLFLLPDIFASARHTQRVLHQNLIWAVAYNTSMLPLAVLGLMPPWLAAVGMSLSSLLVTLNAGRLLYVPHSRAVHARNLLSDRQIPGTTVEGKS